MRRSMALALALTAGLAGGCAQQADDWPRLPHSVPAPEFTCPALDGRTVKLSDFRGQIVLLEFWATWCGPCRYSGPSLDAIYRQYRAQGVTVLLVNEGEPATLVRAFVKDRFAAPILLDRELVLGRHYRVAALPRLFVIDGDGQVQYVRSGYADGLERQLRAILKVLMDERKGAVPHAG